MKTAKVIAALTLHFLCCSMLAWTAETSKDPVSGNISFSASSKKAKLSLFLKHRSDALLNLSIPISIDKEWLENIAFTGKAKLADYYIDAGKLAVKDSASFLIAPVLVSAKGKSMLLVGDIGKSSDPVGFSIASSRMSLLAGKGNPYAFTAMQYLCAQEALLVSIGLGTLLDTESSIGILDRLNPWISMGIGYATSSISFMIRSHIYPDFENKSENSFNIAWLRGIGTRLDTSISTRGQKLQGFFYIETGHFLSALGKVMNYDAMAQIDYDADISFVRVLKSLNVSLSAFSKQGFVEPLDARTPSFGTLPNLWTMKYWPDGGKIGSIIESQKAAFCLFQTVLNIKTSISGALAINSISWSNKIALDLVLQRADSSIEMLKINGMLQGSHSIGQKLAEIGEEIDSESTSNEELGSFEQIEEQSASPNTDSSSGPAFDRLLLSCRLKINPFSFLMSVNLPLYNLDSRAIAGKIGMSLADHQLHMDLSVSMQLDPESKQLRFKSLNCYARIPL
ncbi:MAG: hypothetical protein BWX81_02482 [Spirochaetes bacterium ADurb.Bin110]|nr:MAG: hypothetical protein BWX81_02482 [Spirochaetes bacterium ADurb.Bin110]